MKNYIIKRLFLLLLVLMPGIIQAQMITGLSDWKLFLDPGHAQKENMGLYNYSEAEKVLRVALSLKDMFLTQTDIAEVFMCRLTDADQISLEARTALANTLGADFYYSIHSDAGAPTANSALMLYGGWRSNGVTVEKSPVGGGAFGEILNADLSGAMRIPTRGNWADRSFYLGVVDNHDNKWPYLHVNRTTNMASLLSEAGFHTNPRQQQLNLNAQWKELEALSAFRSLLEFHGIDRPAIGIATGIITDADTGLPANGVTVTIGDKEYTTDSYQSLFKNYSANPEELRNGFFWITGLTPGQDVTVVFTSPFYETSSQNLTIVSNPNGRTHQNLSFLDASLTSVVPAKVVSVEPAGKLTSLVPSTPILVKFSRKMAKQTVEDAISINPEVELTFSWVDDFTLSINTAQMAFLTNYTVTIDGSIARNLLTNQLFDGDADGNEGGNYQLSLTTSPEDTKAPELIDYFPANYSTINEIRPAIRLVFDEVIAAESITAQSVTLNKQGGATVNGEIHHAVINGKSVIHFFPSANLENSKSYKITVAGGLKDEFGNETSPVNISFMVAEQKITAETVMDKFDVITNWWEPQASGTTAGIITEQTNRGLNTSFINKNLVSTGSLRLSYGWNISHSAPYIRLYLPPAASQNAVKFDKSHVLQVYMFGDGSNNQFRFVLRDGTNSLEASQWYTINWIGWKLISWDLSTDPAFGWVNGNGVLDGSNFYLDGLHFRYVSGGNQSGTLYFENLRFVTRQQVEYPETLFESFETYNDFTTDIFPWRTVDVKGDITWNPQGFTFPGSGQPFAFKVLNPMFTDGPIAANHPAYHNEKYLIAMQSQTINDDKWLISPQIKVNELSTLKFFAKSISSAWGLERFQVLVAEDAASQFVFNAAAFEKISVGDYLEAPVTWTPFTFSLSEYNNKVVRFAIRGVSYDSYMLMIDAIEVTNNSEQTNVPELQEGKIAIYPSPARDVVYIKALEQISEVRVFNMSGQLIKVVQPKTENISVDVTAFGPGVYLFHVVAGSNSVVVKTQIVK